MAFPTLGDLFNYLFGTSWSLPIPTFGLFVASAFLIATSVHNREIMRLVKEKQLPKNKNTEAYSSSLAFVAMVSGMIGARIFHLLEYPEQFMQDPWGSIFSRGGWTMLGGLIFGVIAGSYFTKMQKLPLAKMFDVIAPVLILGYGIGRIGCQLAGDGDWGIAANMALKPDWLPNFLWASTFENNVIGEVIPPPGVYPTPLYEVVMSLVIFGILWGLRKHPFKPGWLFSLYLVLSAIERGLIEQIRVNSVYKIFGYTWTQAEIISLIMLALGLYGLKRFSVREKRKS